MGSYERVRTWMKLSDSERRKILEDSKLIYTEEEETWMILKDEPLESLSYY
jgi:predicted Fe-S protein YdhL (DUF1289 family)